jgi:hypothetical protein
MWFGFWLMFSVLAAVSTRWGMTMSKPGFWGPGGQLPRIKPLSLLFYCMGTMIWEPIGVEVLIGEGTRINEYVGYAFLVLALGAMALLVGSVLLSFVFQFINSLTRKYVEYLNGTGHPRPAQGGGNKGCVDG